MKKAKYMCDFETSTDAWLERDKGMARVWASCITTISDAPEIVSLHNNIDDFMDDLFKMGNVDAYFHNLKYDGEYIISWLFHNGYKYDKTGKREKSFYCIISDMGQWYEICITHKVFNKRYVRTTIYDSYKKLPLKVSALAKAFNLPECKGEINYDKYRPVGHELSDKEISYIARDCIIVAKCLYTQFEKGLKKLTIGSDALNGFKSILGNKRAFKYLFPVIKVEVDNDFRRSYKGGFTRVNEKYRNRIVSGISFDVNSLYPSVMYGLHGALPYGLPKKFKGMYKPNKDYPLYIQHLSCYFKLKPDHIPSIQLKHNLMFMPTEYVEDSKEIVDLYLTNVDLELMLEQYDVSCIEYYEGYMFKGASNIFTDYIDYWMNIKANSTGGLRQLAKLMLNSLYGKFATNPERSNKHPHMVHGEVEYRLDEPEIGDPVYTALGAFVTARARAYTIRNAQALFPYWVYSDTDSMYLTGITEEEASKYIDIHPTKLGAWKLEHHFKHGKWLRPKTYILDSEEDGLSIACAGMPDNIKHDILSGSKSKAFASFTYGGSFEGKLVPVRVPGGVVLKKTDFTISSIS